MSVRKFAQESSFAGECNTSVRVFILLPSDNLNGDATGGICGNKYSVFCESALDKVNHLPKTCHAKSMHQEKLPFQDRSRTPRESGIH